MGCTKATVKGKQGRLQTGNTARKAGHTASRRNPEPREAAVGLTTPQGQAAPEQQSLGSFICTMGAVMLT